MLALRFDAEDFSSAAKKMFKRIISTGVYDALFVRIRNRGLFPPALLTDTRKADSAVLLAPVMVDNAAAALSKLLRRVDVEHKIVAFLRPCEARAFVELVKLKQATLDGLLLITPFCYGALSLNTYQSLKRKHRDDITIRLRESRLRDACRVCDTPIAPFTDVQLIPSEGGLLLVAETEKGGEFLRGLGAVEERIELTAEKEKFLRERRGEEFFTESERLLSTDGIVRCFSECILCYNCMRLCPVCYCRFCFFESEDVEASLSHHLSIAEKDGLQDFIRDILLFHLGRLEHIGSICVRCGVCDDACPSGVKPFRIFGLVSKELQKMLNYSPGTDPGSPLPQATYRKDEFEELGR